MFLHAIRHVRRYPHLFPTTSISWCIMPHAWLVARDQTSNVSAPWQANGKWALSIFKFSLSCTCGFHSGMVIVSVYLGNILTADKVLGRIPSTLLRWLLHVGLDLDCNFGATHFPKQKKKTMTQTMWWILMRRPVISVHLYLWQSLDIWLSSIWWELMKFSGNSKPWTGRNILNVVWILRRIPQVLSFLFIVSSIGWSLSSRTITRVKWDYGVSKSVRSGHDRKYVKRNSKNM